jgi:hypothetical protein
MTNLSKEEFMQTDNNNNNPIPTEADYRVTSCINCEENAFEFLGIATSEGGPFGTF